MELDRRDFLGRAAGLAAAFVLGGKAWAQRRDSVLDAPAGLTLRAEMAPGGEPGERLIVSGRLLAPDGRMPLAGAKMYAYNTGANGLYSPSGVREPRIRGWLQTDSNGRYELHTIKPGLYPGGGNPAHIHAQVSAPGYPTQWLRDFLFEGDPYVKAEEAKRELAKGRFSAVLRPVRSSDGILRAERDIVVQKDCRRPDCHLVTGDE